MKTVIFGASKFGKAAFFNLKDKFNISFFCDNSKDKQGEKFCGLDIISPEELSGKNIIVASYYNLEIVKQLLSMGILDFYVAFDNGKGKIEASFIELSQFDEFDVLENKVCLVCDNNSGSNTLAINKLAKKSNFDFVLVHEVYKDTFYYYHLLTSRIVFKTHGGSALDGAVNIQIWHGLGLKPLGYMDRSTTLSINEPKHKTWLDFDAVFTYSHLNNLIFSACFGVPINKYYITGAPRNDFLFMTDGRALLSDILDFKLNSKLILYAPTFRKNVYGFNLNSQGAYLHDMKGMELHEFDAFLESCNYHLVMKMHPRDTEEAFNLISPLKNISILLDDMLYNAGLDFYEVLNAFDCLISDYSSLSSDFLLLDRPIIYMPIDIEEYEKRIGFLLEPYDFWCPGEKVYDYQALILALKNIFITDNFSSERKIIRRLMHRYQDGNSTERVIAALNEVMRTL